MFSKASEPNAEPMPQRQRGNATRSVIGTDLAITGEITSTGALEILGVVDGNVTAETLLLGQQGRISGSVSAVDLEIHGQLDGKIDSRNLTLRAAGKVTADITYETLVIESGASIEGRFSKPRS